MAMSNWVMSGALYNRDTKKVDYETYTIEEGDTSIKIYKNHLKVNLKNKAIARLYYGEHEILHYYIHIKPVDIWRYRYFMFYVLSYKTGNVFCGVMGYGYFYRYWFGIPKGIRRHFRKFMKKEFGGVPMDIDKMIQVGQGFIGDECQLGTLEKVDDITLKDLRWILHNKIWWCRFAYINPFIHKIKRRFRRDNEHLSAQNSERR